MRIPGWQRFQGGQELAHGSRIVDAGARIIRHLTSSPTRRGPESPITNLSIEPGHLKSEQNLPFTKP